MTRQYTVGTKDRFPGELKEDENPEGTLTLKAWLAEAEAAIKANRITDEADKLNIVKMLIHSSKGDCRLLVEDGHFRKLTTYADFVKAVKNYYREAYESSVVRCAHALLSSEFKPKLSEYAGCMVPKVEALRAALEDQDFELQDVNGEKHMKVEDCLNLFIFAHFYANLSPIGKEKFLEVKFQKGTQYMSHLLDYNNKIKEVKDLGVHINRVGREKYSNTGGVRRKSSQTARRDKSCNRGERREARQISPVSADSDKNERWSNDRYERKREGKSSDRSQSRNYRKPYYKDYSCFRCSRKGHFRRNCWSERPYCKICRSSSHAYGSCSKWTKVYDRNSGSENDSRSGSVSPKPYSRQGSPSSKSKNGLRPSRQKEKD